jgi:hypothetical protein
MPGKSSMTGEQVVTILAAMPERIAALTDGLTSTQLQAVPTTEEWSLNDILAHLRACADVWGPSMRRVIAEDHPTIRAINPQAWIERMDYRDLDFRPSFEAYAKQRAELLTLLEPLPQDGWMRTATVTGAGAPLQRTVLDWGVRMARHERAHVKHMEAFVRAAVTPGQ